MSTTADSKIVHGGDVEFASDASPQADRHSSEKSPQETTKPIPTQDVNLVMRRFLYQHARIFDHSAPYDAAVMGHLVPYLKFNSAMVIFSAPVPVDELFNIIEKGNSDLAYLLQASDMGEQFPNPYNLTSQTPAVVSALGINELAISTHLEGVTRTTRDRVHIPDQYFLSLFVQDGEIYRNFLASIDYKPDSNAEPYFLAHTQGGNVSGHRPQKSQIPLEVSKLRKFVEDTGERRLSTMIKDVKKFHEELSNAQRSRNMGNIRDVLYSRLKNYNPQLTEK